MNTYKNFQKKKTNKLYDVCKKCIFLFILDKFRQDHQKKITTNATEK